MSCLSCNTQPWYADSLALQVGPGFNRDYWARFEKFTKDVVKKSDDVYIVTGPVFAPALTASGLRSVHGFIGAPALLLLFRLDLL